ncbi:hypothetical protein ACFS2C_19260 [Prauserella oleivorans]|uniref:Recombinase XerD n=1 Tax=Prauserella oleivorans TaxID=1478153 RepID=A0ABW5WEJ4_9PSEU
MRPVNARDDDGRGFCGSCYRSQGLAPREKCTGCGTAAIIVSRRDDTALCGKCYRHPERRCGICGRIRRVGLRATATSPDICRSCFQAPEIICSLCGDIALGRRSTANGKPMCFRCQATQRVDAALTGPDGTIPAPLKPVRDAIVSAEKPRSVLNNFTRNKGLALLSSIARGERPLSHDCLDAQAGLWSVEHLRTLLVAAGALPERDENLARLQRFVNELVDGVAHPGDRRLLHAFARWHVIPRLRHRYPQQPVPENAAHGCRDQLTAALRFLSFLRKRSRQLDNCRQADLDAWFDTQRQHISASSKAFLRWARERDRLSRALTIPVGRPSSPKLFSAADERWAHARSLLHDDDTASVPDRVAACLILLYAQPVTHIAALTTEHIHQADNGTVQLKLGHASLAVLPALGRLLTQLPCELPQGTARNLAHGTWLFPGRRPGHHLHAHSLSARIRTLGVDPRPDRNSALLELARELPPAVVGKLLGLHPGTAAKWAEIAGSSWARYAATHQLHH